jgi:hypothetical protein
MISSSWYSNSKPPLHSRQAMYSKRSVVGVLVASITSVCRLPQYGHTLFDGIGRNFFVFRGVRLPPQGNPAAGAVARVPNEIEPVGISARFVKINVFGLLFFHFLGFPNPPSCRAVLRLWQDAHIVCRFLEALFMGSPSIWSTCDPGVMRPRT